MINMIAMLLAFSTLSTTPNTLLKSSGTLEPGGSFSNILAPIHPNATVSVNLKGSAAGELDCYLLKRNPKGDGWVVAASSTEPINACVISYTPTDDLNLKLWVINDADKNVSYTVEVDQ